MSIVVDVEIPSEHAIGGEDQSSDGGTETSTFDGEGGSDETEPPDPRGGAEDDDLENDDILSGGITSENEMEIETSAGTSVPPRAGNSEIGGQPGEVDGENSGGSVETDPIVPLAGAEEDENALAERGGSEEMSNMGGTESPLMDSDVDVTAGEQSGDQSGQATNETEGPTSDDVTESPDLLGGSESLQSSEASESGDDGCGCSATTTSTTSTAFWLLLALLCLRPKKRKRSEVRLM